MLKYVSLVFLLLGVASAKKGSKDTIPANCTDQENFTLKPNEQVYINCQNDWDNISITIDSDGNAKEGLSLEFKSLTNFKDSNAVKIYGYEGTTEKLIYQGNPFGTNFWLVTGQSKIRIEAKHVTGSTISVYVKQSCVQEAFDLPTFVSPILPNQPLSKPGIVNCNYKFTHPSIIDFTKVTLKKTSEAKFTGTSDDKLAGPFTNATPDHIVILQPNAVLALKLDLGDADQSLTFNKQIISDMKSCGDKQMITVDSPMTIPVSGLTNGGALMCDWLLVAPEGQKLTLTVSNMTLEHVEDLVSVVDGGLFSAKPLVQLTALNQKSSPVISSGRYLVVSLNSKNFDAKEGFSLTANVVSSGGHLYQNGTMSIQETGDFYLSTSDTEDLVVSFTALTRLNDSQKLVVYADSMELVTFDAAKPLFDISSPGSELRIVASGFSKTAVNLPFTSKPRGSACMRTFIAAQETGMKLIGKCDGQCTWIIKPNVQKEVTQMFMRVLPNNVPTGTITHFRNSDGKISLANSAEPFLLSYRVEDGALINFDCSNAKDFEMSYVTKVANQDVGRTVAAGQNFTLTSPFFPGIYPQGAVFNYSVNLPDPKISYLASFRIMDLLPGHNLAIGKSKDTQFTGSDLPGDVLIPAGEFAITTFDSLSVEDDNPKGGYGFYIDLAPASSSQTLKDASKSISTGDQCNKPRCVYIIDLPKPEDKNSSVSVNLTVAIPKDRSLNESDLLVWDGESVLRSALIAPIANLTKGGFFASKSNKLVIVYKGALNLNMSFVASPCSYKTNTMCSRDRLCMPLSWRCDGTAQCSDGSDEWHCTGGHPPTPQPDPAPAPSSGWKVAFWLFMPVFMLLGVAIEKLVPKLIQRVRDSRYQQFHDLGDH